MVDSCSIGVERVGVCVLVVGESGTGWERWRRMLVMWGRIRVTKKIPGEEVSIGDGISKDGGAEVSGKLGREEEFR